MKNEDLRKFSVEAITLIVNSRSKLDAGYIITHKLYGVSEAGVETYLGTLDQLKVPSSALCVDDISGYSTVPTKGPDTCINWKDVGIK